MFVPEQHLLQGALLVAGPVAVGLGGWWSRLREEKAKHRRTNQEGFFGSYTECLNLAIIAARSAEELSVEEIRKVQESVLKLVCQIVTVFLGNEEGLSINANVMREETVGQWAQDGRLKGVLFSSSDRHAEAYHGILHLTVWAKPPYADAQIALPIATKEDILLFGAPRAFVHNRMEYVANTKDQSTLAELVARQDDEVRHAITDYFSSKNDSFVSFVCCPLSDENIHIGVLNVQSNCENILGEGEIYRAGLEQCLLPLRALLGILLAKEKEQENATSSQL